MEQNVISREKFWNNGGVVKEELSDYQKVGKKDADHFLTIGDALLTLICC